MDLVKLLEGIFKNPLSLMMGPVIGLLIRFQTGLSSGSCNGRMRIT